MGQRDRAHGGAGGAGESEGEGQHHAQGRFGPVLAGRRSAHTCPSLESQTSPRPSVTHLPPP